VYDFGIVYKKYDDIEKYKEMKRKSIKEKIKSDDNKNSTFNKFQEDDIEQNEDEIDNVNNNNFEDCDFEEDSDEDSLNDDDFYDEKEILGNEDYCSGKFIMKKVFLLFFLIFRLKTFAGDPKSYLLEKLPIQKIQYSYLNHLIVEMVQCIQVIQYFNLFFVYI
jgi:hypothetical protein